MKQTSPLEQLEQKRAELETARQKQAELKGEQSETNNVEWTEEDEKIFNQLLETIDRNRLVILQNKEILRNNETLLADATTRLKEIESRIAQTTGKVEEETTEEAREISYEVTRSGEVVESRSFASALLGKRKGDHLEIIINPEVAVDEFLIPAIVNAGLFKKDEFEVGQSAAGQSYYKSVQYETLTPAIMKMDGSGGKPKLVTPGRIRRIIRSY